MGSSGKQDNLEIFLVNSISNQRNPSLGRRHYVNSLWNLVLAFNFWVWIASSITDHKYKGCHEWAVQCHERSTCSPQRRILHRCRGFPRGLNWFGQHVHFTRVNNTWIHTKNSNRDISLSTISTFAHLTVVMLMFYFCSKFHSFNLSSVVYYSFI